MPQLVPFFKRSFSTSSQKRGAIWPGVPVSIETVSTIILLSIPFFISFFASGIYLIHGSSYGNEMEFTIILEHLMSTVQHITRAMLDRLTQSYSLDDLSAFLGLLRGIITMFQGILEQSNIILENVDPMTIFYDRIFNDITQLESILRNLLFIYRRMELELGITPGETDLVPDPDEEDFYAAYVLALTGQGV